MKTVLFACIHNAGRSQIAAALFNTMVDLQRVRAVSAGTEPLAHVHPEVVTAMLEIGIDLGKAEPRRITPVLMDGIDIFISVGCGLMIPLRPGVEVDAWSVLDPKSQPLHVVRKIREELRERVRRLVATRRWERDTLRRGAHAD